MDHKTFIKRVTQQSPIENPYVIHSYFTHSGKTAARKFGLLENQDRGSKIGDQGSRIGDQGTAKKLIN